MIREEFHYPLIVHIVIQYTLIYWSIRTKSCVVQLRVLLLVSPTLRDCLSRRLSFPNEVVNLHILWWETSFKDIFSIYIGRRHDSVGGTDLFANKTSGKDLLTLLDGKNSFFITHT